MDTLTKIQALSPDPSFDFEIRTVLGHSVEGVAEPGEVLAAVAGVEKGDVAGYCDAWQNLAERVMEIGDTASAGGHRVSAAEAYLRASNYFAVAVNASSALGDDSMLLATFRRQQAAWDKFVAHSSITVDSVAIPYENTTLPGWFFRSPSASTEGAPTLVAVNGSDGALVGLWATTVSPALRRGYNVLAFDGPGQQSELFDHRSIFRPDWEAVLTPVYNYVAGSSGVDASRIAVYGISQAGYWVARAVAFEHRFVAAIVDPGVVDVSTSWTSQLPAELLSLLDAGHDREFDAYMDKGLDASPEAALTWSFRARPYGTTSYADTIRAVRKYTVADTAAQITTPLLVLSPEDEQFWPGQAEQLASLTSTVSTLVAFTAAEGANYHCQPLARTLTAQRMFDWLDDRLRA
jgi:dipeptidyl aminopeptidase/acylaminoacyl peptidase